VLSNYLNANKHVPWADLRYITDACDRRTNNAFLAGLVYGSCAACKKRSPLLWPLGHVLQAVQWPIAHERYEYIPRLRASK
jgi:hypothetical protein